MPIVTPATFVVWCSVFNIPSFFFTLYMLLWPFIMWMLILHLQIFLKIEKNGTVPKYIINACVKNVNYLRYTEVFL